MKLSLLNTTSLAPIWLVLSVGAAAAQGCGPTNPNCIVPLRPLGDNTGSAASTRFVQQNLSTSTVLSPALDAAFGSTRGSILERATTSWQIITPGTSGLPFVSNGPGTDPTYQALTNSGLATMPANTVKCNNSSSTASVADCTSVGLLSSASSNPPVLFSMSLGGANPNASIPLENSPTAQSLIVAGAYADSTNTSTIYQMASWLSQSGSRPAVGVLGQAQGTGASSQVWGGNFVAYASANGAVAVGAELDAAVGVSGGTAFNATLVTNNAFSNPGAFLQIQSNNTGQTANGIVFNKFSGNNPISGSLITTDNTPSQTNGVDMSAATFSGCAYKGPGGFCVDNSGNINISSTNLNAGGVFVPTIVGGVSTSSTLQLRSTTGVGATDAIIFQVGNNGGTEGFRILDSGQLKMGTPSFTANGSSTVTVSNLLPNGHTATIAKWLTIQDASGTTSFIPVWQ
jgi:hypothetical protein